VPGKAATTLRVSTGVATGGAAVSDTVARVSPAGSAAILSLIVALCTVMTGASKRASSGSIVLVLAGAPDGRLKVQRPE
jgi:hypothetical protein